MLFVLGAFRGLWFLVAVVGTAFCFYEQDWIGAGLWVMSTYIVTQLVFAIARRMIAPPIDTNAIAEKIYDRVVERIDADR